MTTHYHLLLTFHRHSRWRLLSLSPHSHDTLLALITHFTSLSCSSLLWRSYSSLLLRTRHLMPFFYSSLLLCTLTTHSIRLLHTQNCRFLQKGRQEGHEAETESIARLTEALREAKPLKVAITNWRKDGTAFRNLLAIKPIMDQNGDYVSSYPKKNSWSVVLLDLDWHPYCFILFTFTISGIRFRYTVWHWQ